MSAAVRQSIQNWLQAVPMRRRVWELLCRQPVRSYLVGGSVRDALLGMPAYDMDLAVDGDALALGRQVADAIGGAFVPLDPERNVARIVLRTGGVEQHVDLAGLRAQGIMADLRARDLTVNAMAVAVQPLPGPLIDPTAGLADLQARCLRVASGTAFADDPVRILRAVRLSGALGFGMTPETEALARAEAGGLQGVSRERLRDELLNILAQTCAAEILGHAGRLGLVQAALPELAQSAQAVGDGLQTLSLVERDVGPWLADDEGLGRHSGPVAAALEPFWRELVRHWREPLAVGRPRWLMFKLAAALGTRCTRQALEALAERLRTSAREARYLVATPLAGQRACMLGCGNALPPLSIYRYYREAGEAGVGGAVLALGEHVAGAASSSEREPARDAFPRQMAALVQAWFERYDQLVNPPALVTGRDVMRALRLPAGPEVGRALEAVREAQVQGLVSDRATALEFARSAVERRQ